MTTIILLEQSFPLEGVYDATEKLVNYHVHAVQARFPWELEERVATGKSVRLAEVLEGHWPLANYQVVIRQLEAVYPVWSVYDHRVVFFLNDLAALVKEPKVLWVDFSRSKNDYEAELHKLSKSAFDGFKGPKLKLTKDDPAAVKRFIRGEPEEAPAVEAKP